MYIYIYIYIISEWGLLGNGLVQPLGMWLDRGLLPGEALFPAAAAAAAGSAISFDVLHFSLNRAESPSNEKVIFPTSNDHN